MAQPLAAFQDSTIYVDSLILAGFMDATSEWHEASRAFVYRAVDPSQPIRMVTATLTFDEAAFILLEKLVALPPFGIRRSRGQYLRDHPDAVRQLMISVDSWMEPLVDATLIEPVELEDIYAMRREMLATGLLPRDAIHVAVMRRMGITAIASDDDDFERCQGITLYKP